jgi:hypothetical protein
VNRVTLDSNVYLSGFVFGGKPKRVLEMAIDGEIEVAVSDPIIQEPDMATTATLPDREAQELETRSGRRQNGAWQSASLPVRWLMSSSINCEVMVSNVVSMIVIVPAHDSCTTVGEAVVRRSRSPREEFASRRPSVRFFAFDLA